MFQLFSEAKFDEQFAKVTGEPPGLRKKKIMDDVNNVRAAGQFQVKQI